MMKPPSLQLYVLRHPELEQAAWVRAGKITEASVALSNQTNIPVVVSNDYGWVLYRDGKEERQYTNDEERPLLYWEYLVRVRGPADLKCMPEHIWALTKKRAPRGLGKSVIGPETVRSTPLGPRSVPATAIAGQVGVWHSGYRRPYSINAFQLRGSPRNLDCINIGQTALLELAAGEEANLKPGDMIQARLKGDNNDYFVTGQVTCRAVIVNVVAIEKKALAVMQRGLPPSYWMLHLHRRQARDSLGE